MKGMKTHNTKKVTRTERASGVEIKWLVEEKMKKGIDQSEVEYVHRMTSFTEKEKAMNYQRHLCQRKTMQSRLLDYFLVKLDVYPPW